VLVAFATLAPAVLVVIAMMFAVVIALAVTTVALGDDAA
jgi:hypothetical protein